MRLPEESTALFLGRLTFFLISIPLDIAAVFPFLAAGTLAALLHGVGWSLLLALIAGGVVSLVAQLVPSIANFRTRFDEIYRFRRAYQTCNFCPVTIDEYVAALVNKGVPSTVDVVWGYGPPKAGRVHLFPTLQRTRRRWIRFVAVRPVEAGQVLPSELTTFSTAAGSWIFLNARPERLSGLQHFSVLHEIGHSSLVFSSENYRAHGTTVSLIGHVLILALIPLSVFTLSVWLALTLIAYVCAKYRIDKVRQGEFGAEVDADLFGLERSSPTWFGDQPAMVVARAILGGRAVEEMGGIRAEFFALNLERLRRGWPLIRSRRLRPIVGGWRKFTFQLAEHLTVVLLVGMAVWWYVPPSPRVLVLLSCAAVVALLAYLSLNLATTARVEFVDYLLGVTDAPDDTAWWWRLIPEGERRLATTLRNRAVRVVPPDDRDPLFTLPVTVSSNERTLDVTLHPAEAVDWQGIDRFEYHVLDRWAAAIMLDGRRRGLGVPMTRQAQVCWNHATHVMLFPSDAPESPVRFALKRVVG